MTSTMKNLGLDYWFGSCGVGLDRTQQEVLFNETILFTSVPYRKLHTESQQSNNVTHHCNMALLKIQKHGKC